MNLADRVASDKCPLCQGVANTDSDESMRSHGYTAYRIATKCARCGDFSITWEALEELERLGQSAAISGIAREWTELGRQVEINKDNLLSLINLAPKTFKDRRRRLLQALARRSPTYG